MNKVITILVVSIGSILFSCKSANQKEASARRNVVDANQELIDTKASNAAEWKVFRAESQAKIMDNKQRIAELKVSLNKPGTTFDGMRKTRIEKLETKNNELQSKLNNYDGNSTDWKTFKSNFNKDMKEIGDNIKNIF